MERGLRAVALAILLAALWRAIAGPGAAGGVRVKSSELAARLPSLEAAAPAWIHVRLDSALRPRDRDALAAVAHTGTRVTWSGDVPTPLAAAAVRGREPDAPVRVAVWSPAGVELFDATGTLDTVAAADAARGATLDAGEPLGALGARSGHARAHVEIPAARELLPVLVLGRAGWEAKFAAAALEERGWRVDERIAVAPGTDVTQGAITGIDTAHFSAAVLLDSAAGAALPSLVRFVRDGGGLVLMGNAAAAPSLRGIAPARVGAMRPGRTSTFDSPEPLDATRLYPLEGLRTDAVPLSLRGSLRTAAARREGGGRVLQAGFADTWRWRMQGGAGAVAAHRAWWSRVVASVAATAADSGLLGAASEGAPLARLVDRLGPGTEETSGTGGAWPPPSWPPPSWPLPSWPLPSWPLPSWPLPLALFLVLFAEWGSRRLRGAK